MGDGEVFLKDPKEQAEAAEKLGIAAIRYFDMKQNRTSNYIYDADKMLDPKGNSAVYLFYAYARIAAIQRKAAKDTGMGTQDLNIADIKLAHSAERDLALKLLQFPDVIEGILSSLHLHQLTDYLWELSQVLTSFYSNCRVLECPEQNSRLIICEATRKILVKSFDLLGFQALEKI